MPTTFNGIGTTYYGRHNVRRHAGVCEGCGRAGDLEDYETRLWFVVLLIPVVPLGKKKVLDHCPACTRHRALPLAEWQRFEEEAVATAVAESARVPDDAAAALKLHGTLLAVGRFDEADRLVEALERRFASDLKAQLRAGDHHRLRGRPDAATAAYARALALAPDDREARVAVALDALERKDVPQAVELVRFVEEPSAAPDPGLLCTLAGGCQAAGAHVDALRYLELALRAAPALARDRGFVLALRRSEQAAGRGTSLVPVLPRAPRGGAPLVAAAAAAAVVGALGWNFYVQGHRTVRVVNATGQPARVTVGGVTVDVPPRGWRPLVLAEGAHVAQVTCDGGGRTFTDSVPLRLGAGFWDRFTKDPCYVLNVRGAGVLVWEQAVYSSRRDAGNDGRHEVSLGQPFLAWDDVDYPFTDFPPSLSAKAGTTLRRTRVSTLDVAPLAALDLVAEGAAPEPVAAFLEAHLDDAPGDPMLHGAYLSLATSSGLLERARAFLAGGTARRPLEVEWHRAYQNVHRALGTGASLRGEYARLAEQEPRSSGLLYLAGRAEPSGRLAVAWYDRAIAADPADPYPLYAKGYQLVLRGDAEGARPLLARAVELRPEHGTMTDFFLGVRFALGELEALERELRAELGREPLALGAHQRLLEVLAARGDAEGARAAHAAFARAVRERMPEDPYGMIAQSELALLGLTGDHEQLLRLAGARGNVFSTLEAQLGLGRVAEVEQLMAQGLDAPLVRLLVALAWLRRGDRERFQAGLEAAAAGLDGGGEEEAALATVLRAGAGLDLAAVDDVTADPALKSAALLCLAAACPGLAPELRRRAQRTRLGRGFPYGYLASVAAETSGP